MMSDRLSVVPFLLLFVSLILSFVTVPIASQEAAEAPVSSPQSESGPVWTGCVDPVKGYEAVTIGQPTTICLVLASNGDWSTDMEYMRLNFQPIADDYSRFHVPDSFTQLIGSPKEALTKIFPGNITVHSESQTALSFQKLYYNGADKVFPFLTAIIAVEKGNVTGITWDNACVFCANDECEDNTYGFNGGIATEADAQQPVGGCHSSVVACRASVVADCDLMLYVVWTGTDSNGKDFTSSANRFSAFPKQSWSDRFSFGLGDGLSDLMDNIKDPFTSNSSDTNNN